MEPKFAELRRLAEQVESHDWSGWTNNPWSPGAWSERDRLKQAYKERANPSAILGLFKLIDELQGIHARPTVEVAPSPGVVRAAALTRLNDLVALPNPPADEIEALARVAKTMEEMR